MNNIVTTNELAAECGLVADKLNNLLTAIHLRAGLMLKREQPSEDGIRDILEISAEASKQSLRLMHLSQAVLPYAPLR